MINLTVMEALCLPALSDAVLIAGEKGLQNLITSVNIMEVPEIDRFVNKGELLVTTTYPIKDSIKAQNNLIPNLVNKGVSALAIKPVFYDNIVPPNMIKQANEMNFPLIQLPITASFNNILNPILSEILNRQATILQKNEEVHKKFTDLVLRGGDLNDIAKMLSTLQDNPVSIHTNKLRKLALSISNSETSFNQIINELCIDAKQFSKIICNQTGVIDFEYRDIAIKILVHPVIIAGERYGSLILWLTSHDQFDINIVEQAVTIVALEIVKHTAVMEVERRFRSFLIEEIIQKKIQSRIDVVTKGEAYGWDLTSKFLPIVIEIEDFFKFYELDYSISSPANILKKLWTEVSNSANHYNLDTIIVDIGSKILILVKQRFDTIGPNIPSKLFKRIQQAISFDKKIVINAGVGRLIEDIMELSEGYEHAVKALEIGRQINGKSSITHYDDLGSFRILISEKHNPELRKFSGELLGDIIKCDEESKSNLMETLEMILKCNFNLKEAAQNMFIHYNTIRYRVKKIEELAKIDMNSSSDCLSLQLAMQIRKIQKSV
ncbi:MAG: PucR family transcriptional regulator ligand-binding domain-containing protein [Erysipelothrix sp.]|jgi:purine catabolism regulator|nr:PucR family transcriptional regulator ligand-binding domain-containing protein [Erysipelothrix sp.]